jgi:hypothetical protein
MIDPIGSEQARTLDPVHSDQDGTSAERWTARLVLFLRVMAGLSLAKGVYHWAVVCGIAAPTPGGLADYSIPYQVATAFFAVIDLVAAVGLWLAAAWGAVVWLTSVISMIAVEILFPQIYGRGLWVVAAELVLLAMYLCLALLSAREQSV